MGNIAWQGWQIDIVLGYRYAMMCADMQDILGSFFDVHFSLVIAEHVQTCTESSIKESDQERQRNAEEVEDLQKQLSKAAAEACLHWLGPAFPHCVGNIAWQGWQIDIVLGYRYVQI